METLLQSGDWACGPLGLPAAAEGARALVQRAMIRLSVPRGSFPLDPDFGSELQALRGIPRERLDAAALEAARQALLPLDGVDVTEARCSPSPDGLLLQITLNCAGQRQTLEVTANP